MVQEAGADAEDHRDEDQGEDDADPHLVHEFIVLQLLLQLIHTAAVQNHPIGQIEIHDLLAGGIPRMADFVELMLMFQLDGTEDLLANLFQKSLLEMASNVVMVGVEASGELLPLFKIF